MTQIEKQIESQCSFSKYSGSPKNKEQNDQKAHFHNIDVSMVSLIKCRQKSHHCYSKINQNGLVYLSQSFS